MLNSEVMWLEENLMPCTSLATGNDPRQTAGVTPTSIKDTEAPAALTPHGPALIYRIRHLLPAYKSSIAFLYPPLANPLPAIL